MKAMFDVESTLEAVFAESIHIKFPDDASAKKVLDAAFVYCLENELIPASSKIGWLCNRSRRKGCTSLENEYLDRLNRLFSRAKYYYGQTHKQRNEIVHFVSYVRVSTKQQGNSGKGLKNQTDSINQYIAKVRGKRLRDFTEVCSARNEPGPILTEAIKYCESTGATLIVAELDRLSRNAYFILGLQKAGLPFLLVDHPNAPPEYIAILAIRAQYDDNRKKTKETLALSQKPKGVKGCENLSKDPERVVRGRALGAAVMKANADERTEKVLPFIKPLILEGMSHSQIAEKLNHARILNARGKHGKWTASSVRSILVRAAALLLVGSPTKTGQQ